MTQVETMKLALEALENNKRTHHYCEDTWYSCPKHEEGCANESEGDECNCGADEANAEIDQAITAIKEALAQPEQEPVAWANRVIGGRKWLSIHASKGASDKWLEYRIKEQAQGEEYEQIQLYTSPPQRQPNAKDFEDYCQTLHPLWNTRISRTEAKGFFHAGWLAANGITGEQK